MKKFNLAALPLAVAGILASNSALAGTEACFEVYKGADNVAVAAFNTNYTAASCVAEGTRAAAGAADLAPTLEAAIAYELTGNLDVDFDALDGTDTDLHIVYIPTTDIPSGTLITMELSGATFANNADIIHLVQDTDGAGAATAYSAVASTDGAVDGESTITFLTKAGVTITAGTRLAFSLVSTGADAVDVVPVGINISNTGCTDPTSSQVVNIKATSAVTDGGTGFTIAGGASSDQLVADINAQFFTMHGAASTSAEVNAESTDYASAAITARTEFVYDPAVDSLIHKSNQVISSVGFADYVGTLDQAVVIGAADHFETQFITSSDAGASVMAGIYDTQDTGGGATNGDLSAQIAVETGTALGTIGLDMGTATLYNTEATDLFADDEAAPAAHAGATTYNQAFYVLENTGAGVMNFNYTHTPSYTLDFGNANLLDHCTDDNTLHTVGVNGAVLKVPYTYDTADNWVRITNEHSEDAEITVDIFDESGEEVYNVTVGTVGEHASVVLRANELLDLAVADGYMGTGNRHTMTFTVTAPRDTVHGVSVQSIPGGVDRVLPVLDQNVWDQ